MVYGLCLNIEPNICPIEKLNFDEQLVLTRLTRTQTQTDSD
jgi:hypothetical protein